MNAKSQLTSDRYKALIRNVAEKLIIKGAKTPRMVSLGSIGVVPNPGFQWKMPNVIYKAADDGKMVQVVKRFNPQPLKHPKRRAKSRGVIQAKLVTTFTVPVMDLKATTIVPEGVVTPIRFNPELLKE